MASGPNPIEVYQAALAQLRPILATGSATPDSSTTCPEWNVQSLVNHAIAVQNFAFTVLGSGTPDNLNCASRIEIGNAGGKISPMLRDHKLSEIAHTLEDEPMPDRVRTAFPDMSDRDWEAFMRLTTLLYIALSRPIGDRT